MKSADGGGVKRMIGVRDAKARLSELLRDAQLGREWTVTERGRPIARIVPIETGAEALEKRFGRLEQNGTIEKAFFNRRPLPPLLPLKTGLARRLLDADRDT